MATSINVNKQCVSDLLKSGRAKPFIIPEYQRPYAWSSEQAEKVRAKVRCCDRDCWMIGSVSPAMHKYIWKPAWWVVKHKFLGFYKKQK